MTRYCPNCQSANPDDAFWCIKCDTKLLNAITKESPPHSDNNTVSSPASLSYNQSFRHSPKTGIKAAAIIIIALACLTVFILFLNWYSVSGFHGINCQFNEDFWFEGNYLNTSDGWTFTMTKVKDYTLDGVILATKTYSENDWPYDPVNIFSPIDLVIGINDVKENLEQYDYTITSFHNRLVSWVLRYDTLAEYNYFKSHTGNNHIIPHTEAVLNMLSQNISVYDCVHIEGSLVNLHGIRGNEWWEWTTDIQIGNFQCEIILVDNITLIPCSSS